MKYVSRVKMYLESCQRLIQKIVTFGVLFKSVSKMSLEECQSENDFQQTRVT